MAHAGAPEEVVGAVGFEPTLTRVKAWYLKPLGYAPTGKQWWIGRDSNPGASI